MIVSGVAQTGTYTFATAGVSAQDAPAADRAEVVPRQDALAPAAPGGDEPEAEAPDTGGDASNEGETVAEGVLRLLQAGHFKGVADVRLRINFHDQIVAAEGEAARSAANEAVRELSSTVNAQLEQLSSSAELSPEQLAALAELQDTFSETVTNATEAFLGAEALEGEALTGSLQGAFDSLAGSLDSLLVTDAAEQPEDGQLAADAAATDLQASLQALREAFAAAMLKLNDELTLTSFLPELSPAPGRGVAYEKFLAIYNELQAPQPLDDSDLPEPVDVGA